MKNILLFLYFNSLYNFVLAQDTLKIFPNSTINPVSNNTNAGVFYVPKTSEAATIFNSNGIHYETVRTNVIESALNNATNLSECLTLLQSVSFELQQLSAKCEKLIFIYEKMPAWLSSSSDGSVAGTHGWYVLNTKPPNNFNTWQNVVAAITSKLSIDLGISNACFEVWNEPDIGSWTGTMNEYFQLYRSTFDGIKSVNSLLPVGGPASNFWANNIYWKPSYGYISNQVGDSSLLGQLIDSAYLWNKLPDFVTWHSFGVSYEENLQASEYIQQKCLNLGINQIEQIISEWNANSANRETLLASSFSIIFPLKIKETNVGSHCIAAFQDFSQNANEFHNDYGLLSYSSLKKPMYHVQSLLDKMNGMEVEQSEVSGVTSFSSVVNDTLFIAATNFIRPPFQEAIYVTLYDNHFNLNDLDSANFISIAGSTVLYLDSIYQGLISFSPLSELDSAVYFGKIRYLESVNRLLNPAQFTIHLAGFTGDYSATQTKFSETENNIIHYYDSLINAGMSNTNALINCSSNQELNTSTLTFDNGNFNTQLAANEIHFYKIHIPGINSIKEQNELSNCLVFPNPSNDLISIRNIHEEENIGEISLYNVEGNRLISKNCVSNFDTLSLAKIPFGIYFLYFHESNTVIKIIKN